MSDRLFPQSREYAFLHPQPPAKIPVNLQMQINYSTAIQSFSPYQERHSMHQHDRTVDKVVQATTGAEARRRAISRVMDGACVGAGARV